MNARERVEVVKRNKDGSFHFLADPLIVIVSVKEHPDRK